MLLRERLPLPGLRDLRASKVGRGRRALGRKSFPLLPQAEAPVDPCSGTSRPLVGVPESIVVPRRIEALPGDAAPRQQHLSSSTCKRAVHGFAPPPPSDT